MDQLGLHERGAAGMETSASARRSAPGAKLVAIRVAHLILL